MHMYLNHYGLNDQPFSISPDYRFLWLSEKHSEALATLKYGIMENKGFLLLTGDVGTGKTVLLNRLIQDIEDSTIVASITDPELTIPDFFNLLAVEFNMNKKFSSKGDFLIHFKHFLHKAYAEKNKLLLIIDEAQRLTHELLEQIRVLSNIELHNRKLINIFYVGQTEFNEMLLEERNKAVRQRITLKFNIEPLTEDETQHYISHRLKIAGATKEIFTAGAIREIYSFTYGYPRLININCDHALLTGYASDIKLIDRNVIKECKKDLKIQSDVGSDNGKIHEDNLSTQDQVSSIEPEKSLVDRKIGLIVTLVFVILILTASVYFLPGQVASHDETRSVDEIAPEEYSGPLPQNFNTADEANVKVNEINKVQQVTQAHLIVQEDLKPIPQQQIETNMQNQAAVAGILTLKHRASIAGNSPITELSTKQLTIPAEENNIIIYFKYNSNEIFSHELGKIDHMAGLVAYYPETKILIEGFTDSIGNYSYNQKLSKVRADIVKNYFVDKGIAAERIKVFGRGPNNPIKSNDTVEGRKQNRRVEVKLITTEAN